MQGKAYGLLVFLAAGGCVCFFRSTRKMKGALEMTVEYSAIYKCDVCQKRGVAAKKKDGWLAVQNVHQGKTFHVCSPECLETLGERAALARDYSEHIQYGVGVH